MRPALSCNRIGHYGLLARAASILVLSFIAIDIGDASCDPLILSEGRGAVSTGRPDAPDACGSVCVPDCFCCFSTVPPTPAASIRRPRPTPEQPVSSIECPATGFSPVLEHIPIATI